MKDKTNIKTIVITSITTVLTIFAIFIGFTFLTDEPSEENIAKTSAESEKPIPDIEIYDNTNALEGFIDEEFMIEEFLPTIETYFDYTDGVVVYNNETSELVIWLGFTDESFGKFISKYIYDDNKDKIKDHLYSELSKARYLISQKSVQNTIDSINGDEENLPIDSFTFELSSESTPEDKILFSVDNDGVTSFLDLYQ